MGRRLGLVAYALITAAVGCGGNGPLKTSGGTAGAAGGAGTAGSAGIAGSLGTAGIAAGAAGTAAAGSAGQAGATGHAGAGGAQAGVCGAATRPSGMCVVNAYPHAGVCSCQDDTPCVCGDVCVDPSLDDDNCGACGHACPPTATCIQGACGPPVVTVVPPQTGCQSIDVAVSGDRIIFADKGHGQVQSVALAGGAVTTLVNGESAPTRVAVNGATIFWLDADTNTIRKSVAGGAASTVVTSMLELGGFVVSPDGATMYFSSGTTVSRVPVAGGAPVVVGREERGGLPRELALNGSIIAYLTGLNSDVDVITLVDGQIASCGSVGADGNLVMINCQRVGRAPEGLLETILAPPGEVIWADAGEVRRATLPEATFGYDNVTSAAGNISGLATMANTIWFSDDSVIYRAPDQPSSTAFRIARQQNAPRSVAVGSGKVYWSTGDCTIASTDP